MDVDTLANAVLGARTTLGTAGRTLRRAADRDHRRAARAARAGIDLPRMPRRRRVRGQVWAVTMVRNEVDVLPLVLDHLETQGVDRILVSDNGSTDGTLEMLESRAAEGRLLLARDRETAYYQAAKMTLLARAAWGAGADWVVPFDADELWFAPDGLLADRLRATSAAVVGARLFNVFPSADGRMRLDTARQVVDKVAFRTHPLAVLGQGNHVVDRPGSRLAADSEALLVAHLPWRSYDQFAAKVRQGAVAYAGTVGLTGSGDHWRELGVLDDATLGAMWEELLAGREVPGMAWTPRGPLVPADPRRWRTWQHDVTGTRQGVTRT